MWVCVLLMHYIIIRAKVGGQTLNPESIEMVAKKNKKPAGPGRLVVGKVRR